MRISYWSSDVCSSDLSVGVQRAAIHDNVVTEVYGDTVEVKRYGTQDEAYLDMVAGRIDLLLADSVAMKGGFLDTEQGKDYEFVGPDFSDPKYFGDGAGIEIGRASCRERVCQYV